jgi:drug/metabolite transporter, DME family
MTSASAGAGLVLLAAALWAIVAPLSRLMLGEGIEPLEMALWRAVFAWALFVAHVAFLARRARGRPSGDERLGETPATAGPLPSTDASRRPWVIARADLPGVAAFGVVGVAALYATLPLAVREGGAALAAVLLYTAPAWVAVLSWSLLGERLGRRKVAALALTLAGIVGVAFAGGGEIRPSGAAIGWGLAAGISYASLYLFGKRFFARYAPATVFLYALPVAFLCLLPFTTFSAKSSLAWVALLATGSFSTYGAYVAYSAGLMRLEATRAATIATAEPVMAATLAFVLFGERFAPFGYVAAALVLGGVLVSATDREETVQRG